MKMENYNLKGMYEPQDLEEVIGQLNIRTPPRNGRDTIIKNFNAAALAGTGALIVQLFGNYKPIDTYGDLVFYTLICGGITTGFGIVYDYIYKKNWTEALERMPGFCAGSVLGYDLGEVLKRFI